MTSDRALGKGRRGVWTAAAALSVLAGTGAMGVAATHQSTPPPRPVAAGRIPQPLSPAPSTPRAESMSRSVPTSVRIPQVGLHASLVPVHISADGQLPLPEDPSRASWLASSVTPGERGTSIMAGHVDTLKGPAAFYHLSAVRPGMRIDVARADHTTARFTIDAVAVYPKDHFPDTQVYGPTPGPSLRLLTCTGWDAVAREYRDNVVVYATVHTQRPSP